MKKGVRGGGSKAPAPTAVAGSGFLEARGWLEELMRTEGVDIKPLDVFSHVLREIGGFPEPPGIGSIREMSEEVQLKNVRLVKKQELAQYFDLNSMRLMGIAQNMYPTPKDDVTIVCITRSKLKGSEFISVADEAKELQLVNASPDGLVEELVQAIKNTKRYAGHYLFAIACAIAYLYPEKFSESILQVHTRLNDSTEV